MPLRRVGYTIVSISLVCGCTFKLSVDNEHSREHSWNKLTKCPEHDRGGIESVGIDFYDPAGKHLWYGGTSGVGLPSPGGIQIVGPGDKGVVEDRSDANGAI